MERERTDGGRKREFLVTFGDRKISVIVLCVCVCVRVCVCACVRVRVCPVFIICPVVPNELLVTSLIIGRLNL